MHTCLLIWAEKKRAKQSTVKTRVERLMELSFRNGIEPLYGQESKEITPEGTIAKAITNLWKYLAQMVSNVH